MAMKKTCRCGDIIDYSDKYCDKCQEIVSKTNKNINKNYDKNVRQKRDKKYFDFYRSREWKHLRKQVLSYYNNIDLYQLYVNNKIVKADMVHHIIEIKDGVRGWSKRLDFNNLFPCSRSTHNMFDKMYKKDEKTTKRLLKDILKWYKNNYK